MSEAGALQKFQRLISRSLAARLLTIAMVAVLGLVAAGWMLARSRDPRLRTLALVTLGTSFALVFAFRTFFGYYLVQVLPWMAVLFAVSACPLVRRLAGCRANALLLTDGQELAHRPPPLTRSDPA